MGTTGKIEFIVHESESTFLDPRKNYAPTTEKFQVRIDPLTGRTGHFSHFGAIRDAKIDYESYNHPEKKGFCPFCTENRYRATPKFPAHIFSGDRPKRGEAMLIPNLFPYDVYSGVMVMTDEHVVRLSGFNRKRLTDAFTLGLAFFRNLQRVSPDIPYYLMTWNYMPPSGGGLVHPHQQHFATNHPGNQFTDEIRASEKYFEANQASFWREYINDEISIGQRYIACIGTSHWLSSFVSFGFAGDVCCVFDDAFSLGDLNDNHIDNLVSGLLNVFRYYESAGVFSFNAAFFIGPSGQEFFPCHLRITPRTFLNTRDFASDTNFFQTLLSEPISVLLPETLCSEVKRFFLAC
ncbi:MAG TPA: hypothetical protein VHO84_04255 [Syntrophorhabdaceae bacterium]|nr:hypothetical protein [Syntrophorhabdaceae bacterium]